MSDEYEPTPEEVFQDIKIQAKAPNRMANDHGGVALSWDAADAMLQMPDGRAAPTRVRAGYDAERALGVIVTMDGSKQQMYAPAWSPDPNADKEGRKVKARVIEEWSEATVDQIISLRMKGQTKYHLYLAEGLAIAYQLEGQPLGGATVIIGPRYHAWEKGKHAWVLDAFEGESGWAVGGRERYTDIVMKFVQHVISS